MRSPRLALPLFAGLILASCQAAPEENTTSVKIANPYADRLKAMTPPFRDLALRNAVRDSGEHCQRVVLSAYQQDYRTLSMWAARCADTGGWAIFIAPGGDAQVRKCADAKALGIPECRLDATAGEPAVSGGE